MKFLTPAKQVPTVETLLPLGSLGDESETGDDDAKGGDSMYEFLPSAASILEEVVPASFKVNSSSASSTPPLANKSLE